MILLFLSIRREEITVLYEVHGNASTLDNEKSNDESTLDNKESNNKSTFHKRELKDNKNADITG